MRVIHKISICLYGEALGTGYVVNKHTKSKHIKNEHTKSKHTQKGGIKSVYYKPLDYLK